MYSFVGRIFLTKNNNILLPGYLTHEWKSLFLQKFINMDLSKILSISGKPGLYKLVGEAKSNIIVESLIDGKKIPAFAHERISSLHEISIYTHGEDMPLYEVLKNIYEIQEGKAVGNPKKMDSKSLKVLFEKAAPDFDEDVVYTSDMKKVFTWYNLLLEKDLLDFSEEEPEAEKQTEDTAPEEQK